MRLAMKPGVSLHCNTVLPSDSVSEAANVVGMHPAHVVGLDDFEQLREARRVEEMRDHEIAGEALRHARGKLFASGSVDVLEETIEPDLRCASILR